MAIQKQAVPISLEKGVDLKNDPFQIQLGSFLSLVNGIFKTGKRLTKRNGYGALAPLPFPSSFGTTFNGDLTAIGTSIQAYSTSNESWISKGNIQPLALSVLPLIRNNLNQIQSDSAVSSNGLICTAYTEELGSTITYKWVAADVITGQNIVEPTVISTAAAGFGTPKVFFIGNYFIIVYATGTSPSCHLSFIAVSVTNPEIVTTEQDISASYTPSTTLGFDAIVFNNLLYCVWNGASSSGVQIATVSSLLLVSATKLVDAGSIANILSVCCDVPRGIIWASYYDTSATTGHTVAIDTNLNVLPSFPVDFTTSSGISNIASVAMGGECTVIFETTHTSNSLPANFISNVGVDQTTGSVSSPIVIVRSVGLASKAFVTNGTTYYLAAYSSPFQPTYFLINGSISSESSPAIVAKIAYENGGGYLTTGLPSVSPYQSNYCVSYLFKDLVAALSSANASDTVTVGGVYSQTGINLASLSFDSGSLVTAEIGNNLNITGGFLWAYDGYLPVEQGFFLWPESVGVTPHTTGGSMAADTYFYVATYEWTDNQGNAFRSAGSVPVSTPTTGTTASVTVTIPTLRLTYKTPNPVKICVYRWSVLQQVYYQIGNNGADPITSPVLNNTAVDSVTFLDTSLSANITGNNILYTTGGVIEDIGGPAFSSVFIFDDRLWGITSEDPNLLWFSKQVIEGTPVEMSDLLTLYVAPSIGAQGPTGPLRCGAAMDDKLILFKGSGDGGSGIYYINGSGPDNTGANNQYSQPTFVTSMVGCSNQRSIVFQPGGLMFEFASEAGNQIWLLGRDLSTDYIGAPVEALTEGATVLSAISVPGTNEVRFNMSSGITLKYDYYYGQWGIHTTNAVSSTLYQGLHTYISPMGSVFQETPGIYLDGTSPVLMSFLTGHIQLSGISGYQRIFEIQLLGQYSSPHLLIAQLGYDFAPLSEQAIISPDNFTGPYGSDDVYGQTSPYGGPGSLEQWRIQPATQKCQAFQLSVQEVYDPSYNTPAGEGFTLSAFTCVIGVQRGYRPVKATNTVGTS